MAILDVSLKYPAHRLFWQLEKDLRAEFRQNRPADKGGMGKGYKSSRSFSLVHISTMMRKSA